MKSASRAWTQSGTEENFHRTGVLIPEAHISWIVADNAGKPVSSHRGQGAKSLWIVAHFYRNWKLAILSVREPEGFCSCVCRA